MRSMLGVITLSPLLSSQASDVPREKLNQWLTEERSSKHFCWAGETWTETPFLRGWNRRDRDDVRARSSTGPRNPLLPERPKRAVISGLEMGM